MTKDHVYATGKWLELLDIMNQLREENGCPWDKEQTHDSLKRYLLEEAYETLEAIDSRDDKALCDELGDVLLQVVFHSRIAEEEGRFTVDDVLDAVNSKMRRRHPHIFADAVADTSAQVLSAWEAIKAEERAAASSDEKPQKRGLMKVNDNLPALMLAQKVQDKASRVGFDWPDISGPEKKLAEEIAEFQSAQSPEEALEELGDVLFAAVNVARFHNIDSEDALRRAVKKFIRRFEYIEQELELRGKKWPDTDIEEMDTLWEEAKSFGL